MARWKAPDYKVVVKFETPREEVNKKMTKELLRIYERQQLKKMQTDRSSAEN